MSSAEMIKAEITGLTNIARDVFALDMDCGNLASQMRAGQFLHIVCGDKLLRRPISVCDRDGELVRLVFRLKGDGTRWLAERRPGDELDVLGPLGNGFRAEDKRVLLVGGGIGVPPLLLAASEAAEADAILGFGDAPQAILLPEFAARCRSVSLCTEDGSLGRKGLVTDIMREILQRESYDVILSCGRDAMLRAVARVAKEFNVPCRVSQEQRMGCGVGACLVCSCKLRRNGAEEYARVCKDGPVFEAEEVDWDER